MTGRYLGALIVAITWLTVETFNLAIPDKNLSTNLMVTKKTTEKRYRELKNTFIQIGRNLLPWGNYIKKKDIISHIPEILKQIEFRKKHNNSLNNKDFIKNLCIQENTLLTSPPCLKKKILEKEKRKKKIELAKQRIHYKFYNSKFFY